MTKIQQALAYALSLLKVTAVVPLLADQQAAIHKSLAPLQILTESLLWPWGRFVKGVGPKSTRIPIIWHAVDCRHPGRVTGGRCSDFLVILQGVYSKDFWQKQCMRTAGFVFKWVKA